MSVIRFSKTAFFSSVIKPFHIIGKNQIKVVNICMETIDNLGFIKGVGLFPLIHLLCLFSFPLVYVANVCGTE